MSLRVDIKRRTGGFSLNVAFEAGSATVGLMGPSGAGKSMTLRSIAGIDKPDSGSIELNGVRLYDSERKISLPPQKRRVGYLFQNYALFPNMNVERNILSGIAKGEKDKKEILQRMTALMRIEELLKHYPHQLSGGQQQRVALARILVNKPSMLMLDEPFSALDEHLRDRLRAQTKSILKDYDGLTLLVTHNKDEAYELCERILIIDDGRIVEDRPTKELFASPNTLTGATMTGCKNISNAKKTGEYEVEATDWGIRLKTAKRVSESVCAVGIHSHSFGANIVQNGFNIHVAGELEGVFKRNVLFRYETQKEGTNNLCFESEKDAQPPLDIISLGVRREDVLVLNFSDTDI